ncbi:unnamed protein product [Notodromas monacha]|uniref:Uncharacterized protein n=1 Tax=Notodromas monacha TaxID=399045 RepID=A0A7R9GI19_9CRUS|nr:unnamed protein product [Notodromas monacha]CAG0921349.1 unnamed protein product [Notodromas monacha]
MAEELFCCCDGGEDSGKDVMIVNTVITNLFTKLGLAMFIARIQTLILVKRNGSCRWPIRVGRKNQDLFTETQSRRLALEERVLGHAGLPHILGQLLFAKYKPGRIFHPLALNRKFLLLVHQTPCDLVMDEMYISDVKHYSEQQSELLAMPLLQFPKLIFSVIQALKAELVGFEELPEFLHGSRLLHIPTLHHTLQFKNTALEFPKILAFQQIPELQHLGPESTPRLLVAILRQMNHVLNYHRKISLSSNFITRVPTTIHQSLVNVCNSEWFQRARVVDVRQSPKSKKQIKMEVLNFVKWEPGQANNPSFAEQRDALRPASSQGRRKFVRIKKRQAGKAPANEACCPPAGADDADATDAAVGLPFTSSSIAGTVTGVAKARSRFLKLTDGFD